MECLGTTTGGMWTADETSDHISCLELKAALFALQLCKENSLAYTTPVTLQHHGCMYNNKGSTKPACNDITRDIWL